MAAVIVKYLIWIVSPIGICLTICLLAAFGLLGRRKFRRLLVGVATAQLVLFSLPWVSDQVFGHLESQAKQLAKAHPLPGRVDAIVVLGGGLEPAVTGVRPLPDLNDGADRMWTAANLYRQSVAPVVLASGGGFRADPRKRTEAEGMGAFLQALGVPPQALLFESTSRTTLENATDTLKVLNTRPNLKQKPGPWRIALVTSAFHLPRATALFQRAGFEVYPVVSDVRITYAERPLWNLLPKPEALERSTIAIKEYLGRLQTWVFAWFKQ